MRVTIKAVKDAVTRNMELYTWKRNILLSFNCIEVIFIKLMELFKFIPQGTDIKFTKGNFHFFYFQIL